MDPTCSDTWEMPFRSFTKHASKKHHDRVRARRSYLNHCTPHSGAQLDPGQTVFHRETPSSGQSESFRPLNSNGFRILVRPGRTFACTFWVPAVPTLSADLASVSASPQTLSFMANSHLRFKADRHTHGRTDRRSSVQDLRVKEPKSEAKQ